MEIESGKQADRPALAKAFQACRLRRAKLVIAKLDRLSRNAHFLLGLEKAAVDFVAADMPAANRLTVGIMAMVADEERRLISKRTKEGLAAAKARGVKLGGNRGSIISAEAREASRKARQTTSEARAADLAPVIAELPGSRCDELGWAGERVERAGHPDRTGRRRDLGELVDRRTVLKIFALAVEHDVAGQFLGHPKQHLTVIRFIPVDAGSDRSGLEGLSPERMQPIAAFSERR